MLLVETPTVSDFERRAVASAHVIKDFRAPSNILTRLSTIVVDLTTNDPYRFRFFTRSATKFLAS
jgi:hypothetical protein